MTYWHRLGQVIVVSLSVFFAVSFDTPQEARPLPTRGQAVSSVAVTVEPVITETDPPKLKVTFEFTTGTGQSTEVALPSNYLGQTQLYRHLSDFRVQGGTMTDVTPEKFTIRHHPRTRVRLSYFVSSAFDAEPDAVSARPKLFRPMIFPNKFAVIGGTIFVAMPRITNAPISFSWGSKPFGWTIASDLEHQPVTDAAFYKSSLTGGKDLTVQSSNDGRSRIAIIGSFQNYNSNDIAGAFLTVARVHREFFNSNDEQYLMSLMSLPNTTGGQLAAGVGLDHSFLGWVSVDNKPNDILWLMAHEHLHSWFAGQLGGPVKNSNDISGLWFSEGFTDFYTNRTLLKSKLRTADEWVNAWNETISEHHSSPKRLMPNSQIEVEFWQNVGAFRVPYDRGALLAAVIDRKIAIKTNNRLGLDDIIKQMRVVASTNPAIVGDEGAPGLLISLTMEMAGIDITSVIDSVAIAGGDVYFPSEGWGKCLTVTSVRKPMFSVGFDRERTFYANKVATGVDVNGRAYAAGLRDGMKLVERTTGELGNTNLAVTYKVEVAPGEIKALSWMPRGADIDTQTIELGPDLQPSATPDAKAKCLAMLGG